MGFSTSSPAQITGNVNDYSSGTADEVILRITSNGAYNITGLDGGAGGRIVLLFNIGSFTLTLISQSALSAAANRFVFENDYTLAANTGILLVYDTALLRWVSTSIPCASGFLRNAPGSFPAVSTVAGVSAYGTDASFARGGHKHGAARGSFPVISTVGGVSAYGSSGSFADGAHKHGAALGAFPRWTPGNGAYGSTGSFSDAGHVHPSGYTMATSTKVSASGTWTRSSSRIKAIYVEAIGGGGGGGGVRGAASNGAVGGGGGGGGYANVWIINSASTYTVSIGAAGTGGAAGANDGVTGGSTVFGPSTARKLRVGGGSGGTGGTPGTTGSFVLGGAGGAGAVGDFLGAGGPGGAGTRLSGSAAGQVSGQGGDCPPFGGGGAAVAAAAGNPGKGNGGGGGGASTQGATNRAGGAGVIGVVLVWEFS